MANTGDLVPNMTAQLDSYDISGACDELRSYLDMLTNWYVRRSRQRGFDESVDAFDALYTALETVTRVAASLLPLISEEIWRGLTGGRSVHLADWQRPCGRFARVRAAVDRAEADPPHPVQLHARAAPVPHPRRRDLVRSYPLRLIFLSGVFIASVAVLCGRCSGSGSSRSRTRWPSDGRR